MPEHPAAPTPPPPPAAVPPPQRPSRAWRWLGAVVAALACLAVFGLYTAPDFMVMLADQMWACF